MRKDFIAVALTTAVLAVLAAYYLLTWPEAAVVGPELPELPELVIRVEGEASGAVTIQLFADVAPNHVDRIVALAQEGAYDDLVFHRVIDGFMAQTGDVQHGRADGDTSQAGSGGSAKPDLKAEFSDIPFERGVVGMARALSPDSANSQFFIMFAPAPHLNGQYTVVGRVTEGMEVVDAIRRGDGPNGLVPGAPDIMRSVIVVQQAE